MRYASPTSGWPPTLPYPSFSLAPLVPSLSKDERQCSAIELPVWRRPSRELRPASICTRPLVFGIHGTQSGVSRSAAGLTELTLPSR